METGAGNVAIKLAVHKLVARENVRRADAGEPPLTQQEIARGSGVSQAVISTILRRKVSRLDIKTIDRLANYFKVDPGELFDYTPDEE